MHSLTGPAQISATNACKLRDIMALTQRNNLIAGFLTALLIAVCTLAIVRPPSKNYAFVEIEAPGNHVATLLLKQRDRATDCEASIANLAGAILASCPACRIKQLQCLPSLDEIQQKILSSAPLASPSTRLPNGVAVYSAPTGESALAACLESQRIGIRNNAAITCFPANSVREIDKPLTSLSMIQSLWSGIALALSGAMAWFVCWLIIRYEHLHAHLSHDHVDSGPQKFHSIPTPRVGGVSLVAGFLAGSGALLALQPQINLSIANVGYLLMCSAPAFLCGIAEDVTKKVKVLHRLLMTMISGGLGAWLLGATLDGIGVPGVDNAFLWAPFAVGFTVFAVGGVSNAINIIDGYNGLAGGFAAIVLVALAWVAAQVGDGFVFATALILLGALGGFLVWNWPKGEIFLGDGGAYLTGFLLAELSVVLVVRNPAVSPWFPMLLLAYPVLETFFSIYRRKLLRGHSPGHPDALHMHHLIYARLVRWHVGSKDPVHKAERNSKVAPYVLCVLLVNAGVAISFWSSTPVLAAAVSVSAFLYIFAYRKIATWSVPKWIQTTNQR